MRALLLPVKDLRNAKKRLAGVLTREERFGLVEAMLSDMIRTVQSVRRAEKIFVVTNYQPVLDLAEENGWEILREDRQISESDSVDAASRICEQRGICSLLRLPLDLPLVQARDIDELLAIECQLPAMVIVPSRDGTGTNALLRTPPTLFPSHFGEGSFAKHVAEATQTGAQVFIRRNPRLEMDVDDESDLRVLLEHDLSGTATSRWLRESGLDVRLQSGKQKETGVAAGNHLW
ncbi:MAG TPA: 2-phospho-L-lactate guanylyltransferase [Candidatus Acidoferrum sp.]